MRLDNKITDDVNVEQELAAQVPETFAIRDHRTANWLIRRVLGARIYAAQVRRFAETELKRAQREEEFLLARYGAQLERWARHEININGGRHRFVSLPAGRVCIRRVPSWVEVIDESKLIDWCRQHLRAALVITERLLRHAVRAHVQATGEVPLGAEVRGESERLIIQDLSSKSSDFLKGGEVHGAENKGSQQ